VRPHHCVPSAARQRGGLQAAAVGLAFDGRMARIAMCECDAMTENMRIISNMDDGDKLS
jgi:hypothetical protein